MKKIGVFYGSTTGNTQAAAEKIAGELQADIFDISSVKAESFLDYDLLVLGSSTWGCGDLQDDWDEFLPGISNISLEGKEVALFGTGDQEGFSDTFVEALGKICDEVEKVGAKVIGKVPSEGYSGEGLALRDGVFVGLPLDENNQPEMTDERITNWVKELKTHL